MTDERAIKQSIVAFIVGICATFVMGLVVVATLFVNPGAQPQTPQHHTWAAMR